MKKLIKRIKRWWFRKRYPETAKKITELSENINKVFHEIHDMLSPVIIEAAKALSEWGYAVSDAKMKEYYENSSNPDGNDKEHSR